MFTTTPEGHNTRPQLTGSVLNAVLLVGFGVFVGLGIARLDGVLSATKLPAQAVSAIPGEDWHANVRRSDPR
ncbi:MAG: hypothetical protein WBC93_11430 [Sulfitobacter sp.]